MQIRTFLAAALLVFAASAATAADDQIVTVTSKEQLLELLAKDGVTPGTQLSLQYPMPRVDFNDTDVFVHGLAKFTFKDADLVPFATGRKDGPFKMILIGTIDTTGSEARINISTKGDTPLETINYSQFYHPGPQGQLSMFSREDLAKKYAKWGKRVLTAISKGELFEGMTHDQVAASQGWPKDTHTTRVHGLEHEQWVYGTSPHQQYVYFTNGRASGFSD